MNSWLDYVEEMYDEGRIDARTRAMVEAGDIEICPVCQGLNAFDMRHADAGKHIAPVPVATDGEWQCGHCGALLGPRQATVHS